MWAESCVVIVHDDYTLAPASEIGLEIFWGVAGRLWQLAGARWSEEWTRQFAARHLHSGNRRSG